MSNKHLGLFYQCIFTNLPTDNNKMCSWSVCSVAMETLDIHDFCLHLFCTEYKYVPWPPKFDISALYLCQMKTYLRAHHIIHTLVACSLLFENHYKQLPQYSMGYSFWKLVPVACRQSPEIRGPMWVSARGREREH